MKLNLAIALFVFAAHCLNAQLTTPASSPGQMQSMVIAPTSFGEWSTSVASQTNWVDLRARLAVSETTDAAGSRTVVAYLEIHNATSSQNTIYAYYRFFTPEDSRVLRCQLKDSSGKAMPPEVREISGWFPPPCWLTLPYDSTIRFLPMTLSKSMASNGELVIDAGFDGWRFPRGDTNDYYLSGTLKLTVPSGVSPPSSEDKYQPPTVWQGTLKLPPVKIPAKKR